MMQTLLALLRIRPRHMTPELDQLFAATEGWLATRDDPDDPRTVLPGRRAVPIGAGRACADRPDRVPAPPQRCARLAHGHAARHVNTCQILVDTPTIMCYTLS
jgi:hypothetical protein